MMIRFLSCCASIMVCLLLNPDLSLARWSSNPSDVDAHAEKTDPFDNNDNKEDEDDGGLKDPLEPLNRAIFALNDRVDGVVLRPVAQVYYDLTPRVVHTGVDNFLDNLWFPVYFVNFILQGRMEQAGKSLFRFLLNSTMGVLGVLDPAEEFGLEREKTGFGDTLGSWGMEPGPYLMLPLLGPSTFRGAIGLGADYLGNPLYIMAKNKKVYHRRNKHNQWWHWYVGKQALEFVHTRSKYLNALDDLKETSLDYYTAIRSLHEQMITAAQEKIRSDRAKIMEDSLKEKETDQEKIDAKETEKETTEENPKD